jgi:hypothetical protein
MPIVLGLLTSIVTILWILYRAALSPELAQKGIWA